MSYIYLASPYSHPNPAVMEARFLAAEAVLAWLLQTQQWTYSPIVHCHALAGRHTLPVDHLYWGDYDLAMLHRARKLLVLAMPGTKESKGVQQEIRWANALSLEVVSGNLTHYPTYGSLSGETRDLIRTAMEQEGATSL